MNIEFEFLDLGNTVVVVIDRKPVKTYKLPFPMNKDTILYSIRKQGLQKSIENDFIV